jgi:hypothetical protein
MPRKLLSSTTLIVLACSLIAFFFRRKFIFLASSNNNNNNAKMRRLVYGIFSDHEHEAERRIIRNTWMKLPGNCDGPTTDLGACVEIKFLLSNALLDSPSIHKENSTFNDLINLNVSQSVTGRGLIAEWMIYAAETFHSADFIGKGEMTTFVLLPDLVRDIAKMPLTGLYYGNSCNFECCGKEDYCPKDYVFMSGPLYFMSLDLVQFATNPINLGITHALDSWATRGKDTIHVFNTLEDLQTGMSIRGYNRPIMHHIKFNDNIKVLRLFNVKSGFLI